MSGPVGEKPPGNSNVALPVSNAGGVGGAGGVELQEVQPQPQPDLNPNPGAGAAAPRSQPPDPKAAAQAGQAIDQMANAAPEDSKARTALKATAGILVTVLGAGLAYVGVVLFTAAFLLVFFLSPVILPIFKACGVAEKYTFAMVTLFTIAGQGGFAEKAFLHGAELMSIVEKEKKKPEPADKPADKPVPPNEVIPPPPPEEEPPPPPPPLQQPPPPPPPPPP
ncbi:MAG TPA: hypothetical protein VN457_06740 [Chlamydiales bacterium]|nr:hypothetical protein [Chlamydiales bacterium]